MTWYSYVLVRHSHSLVYCIGSAMLQGLDGLCPSGKEAFRALERQARIRAAAPRLGLRLRGICARVNARDFSLPRLGDPLVELLELLAVLFQELRSA